MAECCMARYDARRASHGNEEENKNKKTRESLRAEQILQGEIGRDLATDRKARDLGRGLDRNIQGARLTTSRKD